MSGGSPEQALLSSAAGQMANFYQLIWWMVLLKVAIVFVFLLLTGRTLDCAEAERWGIVNWRVSDTDFEPRLAAEELGLPTSPYRFCDTAEELATFLERQAIITLPAVRSTQVLQRR